MQNLINTIIAHNLTIQTVESFTGGGLAHHFIKFPGASLWFKQSWVLYQLDAKARWLGISEKAMRMIEPVSKEFIHLCFKKASKINQGVVTLVTTGNAGPSQQGKRPVGEFYIGINDGKNEMIKLIKKTGTRLHIQQTGIQAAITLLNEFISAYYRVTTK